MKIRVKIISHTSFGRAFGCCCWGRAVVVVVLGLLCAESDKEVDVLGLVWVESLVSDRASRFVLVEDVAEVDDDDADCDAGGCFDMARCKWWLLLDAGTGDADVGVDYSK